MTTQNSRLHFPPCHNSYLTKRTFFLLIILSNLLISVTGCALTPKNQVGAQPNPKGASGEKQITSVDVAVARTGVLKQVKEYTGTTKPIQEVALRSRVEGQILTLAVDVGNKVIRGETLAKLDDSLLATEVAEAESELAALESEVVQAQARERDAQTQVERARAELEQAKNDAARFSALASQGAIAQQEAESRQTSAKIAQQTLLSAQQQIKTAQQGVAAALGRVAAQKAVVAQQQQRRAYTRLISPINGVVTERLQDEGNLVSPGDQVVKLIDLTQVKVEVAISELEIANLYMGQAVEVSFDAFKEEFFTGNVSQISPAADSASRQIPIEITIANPESKISSGLLARVSFKSDDSPRVIVPETAIQGEGGEALFVLTKPGEGEFAVEKHLVTTGDRHNGKVEIISGLEPGEQFVVRSSKPLTDGERVRLSILSETEDSN